MMQWYSWVSVIFTCEILDVVRAVRISVDLSPIITLGPPAWPNVFALLFYEWLCNMIIITRTVALTNTRECFHVEPAYRFTLLGIRSICVIYTQEKI